VTGRATFGDFLQAAHQHLGGNEQSRMRPAESLSEVTRALSHLVRVLGRYTQDLTATLPEVMPGDRAMLTPWADACMQAREALATSARFLTTQERPHWRRGATPTGPHARRLHATARSLTIGRDLLHTHFTADHGGRRQHSEWAGVVTSEVVTRALLSEIASIARIAADQCSGLALSRNRDATGDGPGRRRLNAACQWLWAVNTAVRDVERRHPTGKAAGKLLSAIPVNDLPPQRSLDGEGLVTEPCVKAICSAERARHLAWRAAEQAAASGNVTTASLRRVAENSTVTSHNCDGLLQMLATRMAQAGSGEISGRLAAAADAAGRARDEWLRAARDVVRTRTVTDGHPSPLALEAGALATWTGRLAYCDPQWSPSDGPRRPMRLPETVAVDDVPSMVAAAHQACEALTALAQAGHDQIHTAARTGQILVPTRSLPDDYDIPYPFARAPRPRVEEMLARYGDAGRASRQAADVAGEVALMVRAPSRVLVLARSAAAGQGRRVADAEPWQMAKADTDTAPRKVPGPVERTLQDLGVTDTGLLARGAGIDRDAEQLIIDAAAADAGQRRSLNGELIRSAGSTTLVNHALRSGNPRAVALLRQPAHAERELEPEP
jgi:hypothetical protein